MAGRPYDIAIAGAGLAGCTLACTLKAAGLQVLVIDQPALSQSSRVAAGIYNPIVFKRTTLSWRAAEMIDHCRDFYTGVEALTGTRFHYPAHMLRILAGYGEQNEWVRKSGLPGYGQFISDAFEADVPSTLATPFGAAAINGTGWLDVPAYLDAVLDKVVRDENVLAEKFDYAQLGRNENGFTYRDYSFKQIVFCEGHLISANPWFNTIPMYPVKGEVLEIPAGEIPIDAIYNGGVYLLRMHNNRVKIGATYNWQSLNEEPTPEGKAELLEKTAGFYKGDITVLDHRAGIRPAAKDRRPFTGPHPEQSNMYVLNGLGTKGVSLGPWCAQQLTQHILNGSPIDPEIDVARFYRKS